MKKKTLVFIGSQVGSIAGWWFGDPFGFSAAVLLSFAGTLVGAYAAWQYALRRDP